MLVKAVLRGVRISPLKARLVADQIRGKTVPQALNIVNFGVRKGHALFKKLLASAIANAENNLGADIDNLIVATVQVNEAPTLKRMQARAKGRGSRILKRASHIEITLIEL